MDRRGFLATVGPLTVFQSGCLSTGPFDRLSGQSGGPLDPITGTWPTYQFDSGRTGYNPDPGTSHEDRTGHWSIAMRVSGTPAVADGTVYVGSLDGFLIALDATTGEEHWRFTVETEADNTFWATPVPDGGSLYIHSDTGIYALDRASGEQHWRVQPEIERLRPETVAISDETVYVERARTAVAALDAATGEERWRYDTEDYSISSAVALVDDAVYFSAVDGSVHAVDADTGERRWRSEIDKGRVLDLAVSAETVFLTSYIIYALDAESGERKWAFNTHERLPVNPGGSSGQQSGSGGPQASPPTIANGTLYVKSDEGPVVAIDAETGELVWFAEMIGPDRAPIVVDDLVYVTGENAVHTLDASSGKPSGWEFRLRGFPLTSPVVVDGVLFIRTRGSDQDFFSVLTGS